MTEQERWAIEVDAYARGRSDATKTMAWRTVKVVLGTAIFSAVLLASLLDVERATICQRDDVICTEWEYEEPPEPGARG